MGDGRKDLNARRYGEVQAAVAVRQVLSAIHYSHRHGICHRDLKFENILWESTAPDAQIKVQFPEYTRTLSLDERWLYWLYYVIPHCSMV